jgi:hypothetical protein
MPEPTDATGSPETVRALREEERDWIRKQARVQRELVAAQRRRARTQTGLRRFQRSKTEPRTTGR